MVLFRPDVAHLACCSSVYDQWCPNSNFFESEEAAWAWSRGRGLQGRVLTLEEARVLATKEWEQLAGGLRISQAFPGILRSWPRHPSPAH